MSDVQNVIIDQPLSEALSYTQLKAKGLAYIEQLASQNWSNLNTSDPGVTILEQLCYAQTELGYCAQFSVEDVLTQANGQINYKNQFFEPQKILTSAPITLEDYRKYVVDQVDEANNIYLQVESFKQSSDDIEITTGRYQAYIYFRPDLSSSYLNILLEKIHFLLNQQRNLSEEFLLPIALEEEKIGLHGKVYLDASAISDQVYKTIIQALNDYVSPYVSQSGFQELREQGVSSDEIFNGPELDNGWMANADKTTSVLGNKRTCVRQLELVALIASIDGVSGVEQFSMTLSGDDQAVDEYVITTKKIAKLVPDIDFKLMQNSVVKPQNDKQASAYLADLQSRYLAVSVQASIDLYPDLPKGHYRNIADYYSVQNTMPDVYAIGPHSLQLDADDYRIAQSRQLKGYLTLFDQLLSNQFAQLAHIGELFSFTQQYDEAQYWAVKDPSITYQRFTTTYYFQPVYQIPDIKALLRGNQAYEYQFDVNKTAQQVEAEAWKKYKTDPFNQYIYGLRQMVESEHESLERRNQMLTHLIARHGDDAILYEDMIKTCQWYGSDLKTLIIVKSVWLQNYQLLSYHRNSAYNVREANLICSPGRYRFTQDALNQLIILLPKQPLLKYLKQMVGTASNYKKNLFQTIGRSLIEHASKAEVNILLNEINGLHRSLLHLEDIDKVHVDGYFGLKRRMQQSNYPPVIDGQLNQKLLNAESKLRSSDFDNYSAFELKLNMILGLSQRSAMLANQLACLVDDINFKKWLANSSSLKNYYVSSDLDLIVVRGNSDSKMDKIFSGSTCLMTLTWPINATSTIELYQSYASQLQWFAEQRQGCILIEHNLLQPLTETTPSSDNFYYLQSSILLPDYICLNQQSNFQYYLQSLIDLHWPAHIKLNVLRVPYQGLASFSADFIKLHNYLAGAVKTNSVSHKLGSFPLSSAQNMKKLLSKWCLDQTSVEVA